jgi:sortase B
MKILLILTNEIKVNMGKVVLQETTTEIDGIDLAYKTNPKTLKKAIKSVLKSHSDVSEIITFGQCGTERKFRRVYADTIAFLEKTLNPKGKDLAENQKPIKRVFEISDKDKAVLDKSDVTRLEAMYIKAKPKVKSLVWRVGDYWNYVKNKTVYKKKITVFSSQYGFVFTCNGIDFLALDKAENQSVTGGEAVLKNSLEGNSSTEVLEFKTTANKLIHNHIPLLTDKRQEVVRKSVQNIAVVAFIVAGVILLYNSVYKSVENTAIQSEIQSIYYDGETSQEVKTTDHKKSFKKLQAINKEIVAWINIAHTKIDYPVLYHKGDTLDSQYYLYKDYEKNYSDYGSIFIDFRSQQGVNSKNVIMHGHHMNDGSMFANLLKYGKTSIDMDFYKKSPTITFSTPKGTDTYKIISVFKTPGNKNDSEFFNYLQGDFQNDAEFLNYVYNVRARSMVNCPVDVNEDDSLITLSTCSYEPYDGYRTVVVARKVRQGESNKVEVAKASKNKNAYFPSDFCYRYGITQTKITSFKTEYKKGNIDWYDGDGKFKGSETLTGGKFVMDRTTTTTKPTSSTSSSTSTTKASTTKATKPKATEPKVKYYTVKFLDANGKVISTQRVKENSSAKAPTSPKKSSDKNYKYTFVKWNKSYKKVRSNLVIKPVYKSTKIATTNPTTATKATKPKTTVPKTTTTVTETTATTTTEATVPQNE